LCTFGPPAQRRPHWILRFEDAEMADMHFDDEDEAMARFDRCSQTWNCTLFVTATGGESMTIKDCPKCGGTHVGVTECPVDAELGGLTLRSGDTLRMETEITDGEPLRIKRLEVVPLSQEQMEAARSAIRSVTHWLSGHLVDQLAEAVVIAVSKVSPQPPVTGLVETGARALLPMAGDELCWEADLDVCARVVKRVLAAVENQIYADGESSGYADWIAALSEEYDVSVEGPQEFLRWAREHLRSVEKVNELRRAITDFSLAASMSGDRNTAACS